ncbi:type I glyceraldehyde-3-phosphate dehydrogenase [Mesoplasma lactucae]|uniref:Glyceraldehyde-3-phosphate dehydrogenase n=1 Tax=Mesoplasma lactucae ATCC 49193 TaxID=81460 RepID=A0A291IS29_9MOLU|nr:type I glyceraldehyde-3-phosphate dehydrogenase [Mesoplasma lactucae]ATG97554.1 type I glyceraldehyde-3-phosphate dehydrogenase [Mesoplasma lactucae ATCC 49193]ATZ19987.1 glyceraldehyde-3-phosphate dehydrogenase [Mesoplasma lactucae ATCC 49193]MCL8217062.1 Glyceraldehyde-3-phosphate dehydrogenase [Mesoplasma lactucae ATCC 49193]
MAKKVAINGFGRIGRLAFRKLWNEANVEIVGINDLTDPKTLAYLLEHDSAHGLFEAGKISFKEGAIIVDGKTIPVFAERDAANLPWGKLGVDLVVESTGFYTDREKAKAHLEAGAKKVLISAPAKGDLKTIVYGVNQTDITPEDDIISAASCTTNCLTPLANVLNKAFGIEQGLMTTVHAVTNDQRLLDLPHSDLRRGRAAPWNIVPTSTGAAIAVGKALPELNGKMDGYALRVPVITGSVTDLTVTFKQQGLTVDQINNAVKEAISKDAALAQALAYNVEQITSTDIIGESHGSIFDSTLTKILENDGKQMVKVVAWYDNESSYTSQFVRTALYVLSLMK